MKNKLTATFKTNGTRSMIFIVNGPDELLGEYEAHQESIINPKTGKHSLVIDDETNLPLFFIPNKEIWTNDAGEPIEVPIDPKEYVGIEFGLTYLEPTEINGRQLNGRYVLEQSVDAQSIRAKNAREIALKAGFKRGTGAPTAKPNSTEDASKADIESPAKAKPIGRGRTRSK